MARRRRFWLASCALAGVALQVAIHGVIAADATRGFVPVLAFVSGAVHTAINLTLLRIFGRTLKRGREPLITGFARRVHGTVPSQIGAYTRHATVAWCVFFAAQLVISAVLLGVSLEYWSAFSNILAWPLVITMFGAEYVYR